MAQVDSVARPEWARAAVLLVASVEPAAAVRVWAEGGGAPAALAGVEPDALRVERAAPVPPGWVPVVEQAAA